MVGFFSLGSRQSGGEAAVGAAKLFFELKHLL